MKKQVDTIFVTGGTGFVGSHILKDLKSKDYNIICLVRPSSNREHVAKDLGCQIVCGNIWDKLSIPGSVDAIIHLVGIIQEYKDNTLERVHVEGTQNIVELAKSLGIKKFIHMSALGTRPFARSNYHKTKWEAEQLVRNSDLTYTIFRPSVIFGGPPCEFIDRMLDLVKIPFITPVAGLGKNKLQPVYVKNVAEAFVDSLDNDKTNNMTFELGGPRQFTVDEIMDIFSLYYKGRTKLKLHIPVYLMVPGVFLMQKILEKPPVVLDQLKMLKEDNICDTEPVTSTFNIKLENFESWCKDTLASWKAQ